MISLAICTRNRAELLRGTLESLESLRGIEDLAWEILLVDNGSSDHTRTVVSGFSDRLPLKYLREPTPGLSHARNRAVEEFSGDYLVWTDDDVRVEEQWLAAYADAFQRWPDAAVFGGPILPRFEGTPPGWLDGMLDEVAGAYAIRDLWDELHGLSVGGPIPYGSNYAIRGDVQRAFRYDTGLGRAPSYPYRSGEETTVINAALTAGFSGWWVPDAVVWHWIPKERQRWRYVWRYYYGHGRQAASDGFTDDGVQYLGRPSWLWRQVVEQPLRLAVTALLGDLPRTGRKIRECALYLGMFAGDR